MSDDPAKGVTDANCKVHGLHNLFIAGSSVFPTVGSDFPTITIVALALRLCDKISERFPGRAKWRRGWHSDCPDYVLTTKSRKALLARHGISHCRGSTDRHAPDRPWLGGTAQDAPLCSRWAKQCWTL